MTIRLVLRSKLTLIALLAAFGAADAQAPVWHVPQSSTRAVLADWGQRLGFGVIWSDGIPDFPTRERDIEAPLADAIRALVSGYGSGSLNLYCPPSTHFPATAYGLDARIDEGARLVFVFGVPTSQECRPR